jgi:triacylglycerol esterase/lipase EstA (alpha/beta hydrolase family)
MRKIIIAVLIAVIAVLFGGGPLLATLHSLVVDHQSPPCPGAEHLLVLSHGFLGTPTTMKYLENEMNRNGFCEKKIRVYKPIKNFGSTTDGVEKGGKRLADEVTQVLADQPSLRDVSFIGLSLGGVYCRAAAAELWERGVVKSDTNPNGVPLRLFVSLASPHAGTGDALSAFESWFASKVIGLSVSPLPPFFLSN